MDISRENLQIIFKNEDASLGVTSGELADPKMAVPSVKPPSTPKKEESDPEPDSGNEPTVPDENDESLIPDENDESVLPDETDEPTIPEDGVPPEDGTENNDEMSDTLPENESGGEDEGTNT